MADNVRVSLVRALVKAAVDTDQADVSLIRAYVKVRQRNDDVRVSKIAAYVKVAKPWATTYAYRVKDGLDQTLTAEDDVVPQPRSMGVRVTRRVHSVSGGVKDEFLYCELLFSALESVAEYESVLTQFGVLAAMTNEVTVMVRDEALRWATYNGTAVQPMQGADVNWRYFPLDIVMLVRDLEQVD